MVAGPEEKEASTETREEEAERVLAAIDPGLVAFSSDKGGVPYYRLHRVVAKAITRKKFIFVSEMAANTTVFREECWHKYPALWRTMQDVVEPGLAILLRRVQHCCRGLLGYFALLHGLPRPPRACLLYGAFHV